MGVYCRGESARREGDGCDEDGGSGGVGMCVVRSVSLGVLAVGRFARDELGREGEEGGTFELRTERYLVERRQDCR